MLVGFIFVQPIPLPPSEAHHEYLDVDQAEADAASLAPSILSAPAHENDSRTHLLTHDREEGLESGFGHRQVPTTAVEEYIPEARGGAGIELSPPRGVSRSPLPGRHRSRSTRRSFSQSGKQLLDIGPNIYGVKLWTSIDFWIPFISLSLRQSPFILSIATIKTFSCFSERDWVDVWVSPLFPSYNRSIETKNPGKIDINNIGSMAQALYVYSHKDRYSEVDASQWQAAQVSTISFMNFSGRVLIGTCTKFPCSHKVASMTVYVQRITRGLHQVTIRASTFYTINRSGLYHSIFANCCCLHRECPCSLASKRIVRFRVWEYVLIVCHTVYRMVWIACVFFVCYFGSRSWLQLFVQLISLKTGDTSHFLHCSVEISSQSLLDGTSMRMSGLQKAHTCHHHQGSPCVSVSTVSPATSTLYTWQLLHAFLHWHWARGRSGGIEGRLWKSIRMVCTGGFRTLYGRRKRRNPDLDSAAKSLGPRIFGLDHLLLHVTINLIIRNRRGDFFYCLLAGSRLAQQRKRDFIHWCYYCNVNDEQQLTETKSSE